tara:strand:- start:381 stop:551 length:171 start_codon:yes stop_codon:yes gene_type:complete
MKISPFIRCVGMFCKLEAHGGVTHVETCTCGMSRNVNVQKGIKEFGSWVLLGNSNE